MNGAGYEILEKYIVDSVYILDYGWKFLYLNSAVMNSIQIPKEELIGHKLMDLFPGIDDTPFFKDLKIVMETRKPKNIVNEDIFTNNRKAWVEINVYPVQEGIICISRDITERKLAEEECIKERDKAQAFLDIADVMILVINTDYNVERINKKGCDILGYTSQEIIGKNWFDNFIPDAQKEEISRVFKQIMAGKQELFRYHENPVKTKNGDIRIIAWHNTLIKNENGNIIGTLSSGEDITDQKTADQALKESEQKYRLISETADDLIIILNENYEFEYINEETHNRILGYLGEDLLSKLCLNFVHPEDLEVVTEVLEEGYNIGEGFAELRFKKKDGSYKWFAMKGKTFYDTTGKIKALIIGRDITERKITEQKLRESEIKYRTLFDNAPVGIGISTLDGKILTMNEYMGKTMGYSLNEALELHLRSTFVKPNRANVLVSIIQEFGFVNDFEVQLKRKNGEIYDALLNSNLLKLEGREVVLTSVRDITIQKEYLKSLEQDVNKKTSELRIEAQNLQKALQNLKDTQQQLIQSEKLASIGLLAAGIAHEINNPLMGVINYAQILRDELKNNAKIDLSTKPYSFLDNLINEGERIAKIVRDLLSFAREDSGQYIFADLNEIINSAIHLLEPKLKHSLVELQLNLNEKIPRIPIRVLNIQQVILNVLQNAMDALKEKFGNTDDKTEKNIKIETSNFKKHKKDYVKITIYDNGRGISEENIQRIFDPFFTTKTKTKDSGVGLGLSISYGIIKDHGGEVSVKSKSNKYTEITILLPTERDKNNEI